MDYFYSVSGDFHPIDGAIDYLIVVLIEVSLVIQHSLERHAWMLLILTLGIV